MAKFSNNSYGHGSKSRIINKKKFIKYLQRKFYIFECANSYKYSLDYLFKLKNKQIHYKISKIPIEKNIKLLESFFKDKINIFKSKLKKQAINVLYLHQDSLKIIKNKKVLKILNQFKKNKLVKGIGVSIYSEKELKYALSNPIYTHIQIPINLADSYYYFKYKNKFKKKIIVARSILLQGILLNSTKNNPYHKKMHKYKNILKSISKKHGIKLEELIFRYIFSLERLNYVLIGSINQKNIKNLINYKKKGRLSKEIMKDLIFYSKIRKTWSNPRNWKK